MARSSEFKTINRAHLKSLCEKGWTDEEIASFFGITRRTLARWKARYPEFAQQMANWKETADRKVERSCYELACGYSHPEEKIFIHNKKVVEKNLEGTVIKEYEIPEVIRVATMKHYAPNPVAIIFWLTNRMSGDWKRTRQEQSSDPLSAKIMDLLRKTGNGNGKHENRLPDDHQEGDTIERTIIVERKTKGVQVVE